MDKLNARKNIYNHVVKALGTLQSTHDGFVPAGCIAQQVKYQMRRQKPIRNVDRCIQKSLCDLTDWGIVARTGHSDYALREALCFDNPGVKPKTGGTGHNPPRRVARLMARKPETLDPQRKARRVLSGDSLSGNEGDKALKRFRANKRFKQETKKQRKVLIRNVTRNAILKRKCTTSINSITRGRQGVMRLCRPCRSLMLNLTHALEMLRKEDAERKMSAMGYKTGRRSASQ
ncbi:uncharacterized protein LOC115621055 [Scaptodrosophila lebanonensis]|uniref:Uncharacterized protein LOC115621055 n=1 Tax=Drosophila lebanonensis TaxID=7225 RepID=A0A6J2T0L6_DROLE|nr:uncharacterized protein LOC115621055 [Scaptodrosophila lebanonensis]